MEEKGISLRISFRNWECLEYWKNDISILKSFQKTTKQKITIINGNNSKIFSLPY
jgi:hypothetical protein